MNEAECGSLLLLAFSYLLLLPQAGGASGKRLQVSQTTHISAAVGETVTLNCSFTYNGTIDRPVYQKLITLEGGKREEIQKKAQRNVTDSQPHRTVCRFSFIIRNIRPKNETVYYCEVKIPGLEAAEGTGNGTQVSVYAEPSVDLHKAGSLVAGEEATLICTVTGFFPWNISVHWFLGNQPVPSNNIFSRGKTRLSNGTFSVLSLYRFTPAVGQHGAECRCQASHPAWRRSVSQQTVLDIKYGPQTVNVSLNSRAVRTENSATEVAQGSPLTLSCSADGNPPPVTGWERAGGGTHTVGGAVAGQSNETLQISAVRREDEGLYWCVARNSYGERNTSIIIKVEKSPQSGYDQMLYLLIAVAFVLLLVTIICIFMHKTQRMKDNTPGGQELQSHITAIEGPTLEGEVYSVPKKRTTKRQEKKPEARPPTVDDTQLLYADIMFQPPSRQATVKKKIDPESQELVYSAVQMQRDRRCWEGKGPREELSSVYILAEMPQHRQTRAPKCH
ncbi:sialic acid-binding Ig-like lectin 6 [Amia ocellicauda]|uniref:sialic acid-binding Ig-like lectin 6 n=1 Tax=Amia ocellicauda TaxID=2972642 RepID=UPI0034649D93